LSFYRRQPTPLATLRQIPVPKLASARQFAAQQIPPPGEQSAGQAFVLMDRYLDEARVGPTSIRKRILSAGTGERFRQTESYDHWIRDDSEFDRVRRYIENNPVRAGLVAKPEVYRWPSANAGLKAVVAG
jgi:hypothetical protein